MPAPARPILFSSAMVCKLLLNQKRVSRRVLTPQPIHTQRHEYKGKLVYEGEHRLWCWKDLALENIWDFPDNEDRRELAAHCPYGKVGDTLWVRENLIRPDGDMWLYAADRQPVMVDPANETAMVVWAHHKEQDYCPSIHVGLSEIRFRVSSLNLTVRIYGTFWPVGKRFSYTFLLGGNKKVTNDKLGKKEARRRKGLLEKGESTVHEFKFSNESNSEVKKGKAKAVAIR